jgi:hypothetical protein
MAEVLHICLSFEVKSIWRGCAEITLVNALQNKPEELTTQLSQIANGYFQFDLLKYVKWFKCY